MLIRCPPSGAPSRNSTRALCERSAFILMEVGFKSCRCAAPLAAMSRPATPQVRVPQQPSMACCTHMDQGLPSCLCTLRLSQCRHANLGDSVKSRKMPAVKPNAASQLELRVHCYRSRLPLQSRRTSSVEHAEELDTKVADAVAAPAPTARGGTASLALAVPSWRSHITLSRPAVPAAARRPHPGPAGHGYCINRMGTNHTDLYTACGGASNAVVFALQWGLWAVRRYSSSNLYRSKP